MIEIKEVSSHIEKTMITLKIMNSLPEWFTPQAENVKKSVQHRKMAFFGAFESENCIGFAALKKHNEYTYEIYNLGVLREYHHNGIGRKIISECKKYCKDNGAVYLTVKTLDDSADYEPYNNTRTFYFKEGFVPLEVFKKYWNEDNPCLFLVKYIGE